MPLARAADQGLWLAQCSTVLNKQQGTNEVPGAYGTGGVAWLGSHDLATSDGMA